MSDRVVILTACDPFSSLHSIASACAALTHLFDAMGFEPTVVVPEGRVADGLNWSRRTRVEAVLPSPRAAASEIRAALKEVMEGASLAVSHDVFLLDSLARYREAVRYLAEEEPQCPWLHWLHSLPPGELLRARLPTGGVYVVPTDASRYMIAQRFHCPLSVVAVVPHTIRAAETLLDPGARDIAERIALFEADVVQLFPASAERLEPKGLSVVLDVFAEFRRRQVDARLVVATSRSNTQTGLEVLAQFRRRARSLGLDPLHAAFTADMGQQYADSVPHSTVVELMSRVSNLFLFPSVAETSSLAVLEAALGKNLLVLNESLPMLREQIGAGALYVPFGSVFGAARAPDVGQLTTMIFDELARDLALVSQRRVGGSFAPERVVRDHLRPLVDRLLGSRTATSTPAISVVVWGASADTVPAETLERLWPKRRTEVVLRTETLTPERLQEAAARARAPVLGVVHSELDVPEDAPARLYERVTGAGTAGAALHPIFRRADAAPVGASDRFIAEGQYASLDFGVYRVDVLRLVRLGSGLNSVDEMAMELIQQLNRLGVVVETLAVGYRGPPWSRSTIPVVMAVC